MRVKYLLLLVIGLALPVGGAWAATELMGPTGTVFLPTADVLGPRQMVAALDLYNGIPEVLTPMRGEVGFGHGLEAGYATGLSDLLGDIVDLNAKYHCLTVGRAGFAVGGNWARYREEQDPEGRGNQLYAVGTCPLTGPTAPVGVRASFGVNRTEWMHFVFVRSGPARTAYRPFGSIEVNFARDVTLSVEAQAGNSTKFWDTHPLHSMAVRWPVGRKELAEVGVSDASVGSFQGRGYELFFSGVQYSFGR
jgi:hypothetical protein